MLLPPDPTTLHAVDRSAVDIATPFPTHPSVAHLEDRVAGPLGTRRGAVTG
jgi:hypothetical protein